MYEIILAAMRITGEKETSLLGTTLIWEIMRQMYGKRQTRNGS